MTRKPAILMAFAALALAGSLAAQTREEAKADGKAFAAEAAKKARAAAGTAPDADRIPNYDPAATRGLEDLADDPDRIEGAARSAASGNAGYRAMQDSVRSRARFDPGTIREVLTRSVAIGENPLDYTSGMAVTGSQGTCVQLPPGSGSAGTYAATCNTGYTASEETRTCPVTLEADVTPGTGYVYRCSSDVFTGDLECSVLPAEICTRTRRLPFSCMQWTWIGGRKVCSEAEGSMFEYTCSQPVAGLEPERIEGEETVTTARDESQCASLAADSNCTQGPEICTDSDPVTRIVDGVAVTQPCWAWSREYTCAAFTEAEDCQALESTPGCHLVREDCLAGEPCRTWERVYDCPLPDQPADSNQYVCDGDVYCIDGSCETITREANNEFKDAVTALHAMDEARGQFDPETLTLFKGTRNTCSSKVFGVLNCCKGKGFPLIPGISLLVAMGCDRAEVLLHERDAQGLCTYVGTYCSDSFLGACLTKKKVYCCFESKLSRILQEQGRRQLPKPWGKPKTETCAGFTLDEFARLDLSRMDFSEVYAEFTEAARLPDELETSNLIQQKIEGYYDRSGQ